MVVTRNSIDNGEDSITTRILLNSLSFRQVHFMSLFLQIASSENGLSLTLHKVSTKEIDQRGRNPPNRNNRGTPDYIVVLPARISNPVVLGREQ